MLAGVSPFVHHAEDLPADLAPAMGSDAAPAIPTPLRNERRPTTRRQSSSSPSGMDVEER
ncbi:MAG TPA: hypothetical protein VKV21_00480 [Solirubrobacteraceae bacterium]|nr:hypothetical protein [Solirubrobacteraceae bacterium]